MKGNGFSFSDAVAIAEAYGASHQTPMRKIKFRATTVSARCELINRFAIGNKFEQRL